MEHYLVFLAFFGCVCVVRGTLQVSPSSLYLPCPLAGAAQNRQQPPSATFTCLQVEDSTPARPNRTVVWLKDGEVVVTEDNRKYRHYRKKKRLQIFDLTYADQGTYECGFSANDTEQRGVAELWFSPVIIEAPPLQPVIVEGEGEEVVVKCIVMGWNYDVTWTVGGTVIASTNSSTPNSRYTILTNGSLIIRDIREDDSGCYTCSVANVAGNVSAKIQLPVTVNGRPSNAAIEASKCPTPEATPTLPRTPTSSRSSCRPLPEGGWTSGGCQVLEDVSFRTDDSFANVRDLDAAVGTEVFRPVFYHQPPACLQTTVGYTVDIECVVTGSPTPVVSWVKDNVTITTQQSPEGTEGSAHYEQLPHNTLRIHSVTLNDSGVYECVAENSEGEQRARTSMRVWGMRDVCGCVVREGEGEGGRRRRITEGVQATSPTDFPWQVLIEYRHHQHLHSDKLCGGTLLRPDWLLTAAHCLHVGSQWRSPSDIIIRVGVVNRSSFEPTQQYLEADLIRPHPEYNTSSQYLVTKVPEYDIALIHLRRPARLTDSVQPACLPTVNSDPPVGTMCHVSGWGHLNYDQGPSPFILHHTMVPLVNYSNCRHDDSYGNAVTRKHLCAGFDEGGPDACQNDSGGPLVCERGGRLRLFGVVNHGNGCGEERKYGLYARVARHNSWIKSVLDFQ